MNNKNKIVITGLISLIVFACNLGSKPVPSEDAQMWSPLDTSKVYIKGRLFWEAPLANAPVDLVTLESSEPYASTITDAEGNFSFSNLEPFSPVFGLGVDITVADWKCSKPDLLDETWFWTARAYQYGENEVRIWLQSYEEIKIPTGELIQMDIELKCP